MKKLNITDIDDMVSILNNKSGLLGLSGVSSDSVMLKMQLIMAINVHNYLEIFYDRVRKYIGQYIALWVALMPLYYTELVKTQDVHVLKSLMITWHSW